MTTPTTIDERARRLVAAVAEADREEPRTGHGEACSVADLYQRLRDQLAELEPAADPARAAEALALTAYLSRSTEGEDELADLCHLKGRIESLLREWVEEGAEPRSVTPSTGPVERAGRGPGSRRN